jgi:uncharacterized protein YbaP (TraB family)
MRRLADAREEVETWRGVETKTTELVELLELAESESDSGPIAESFMFRFIDARNRIMAGRMAARLDQGGAFIAVGALHLPGEKGLVSLLKSRGYRLEPVY